jgi:hypothetical protein
MPARTDSHIILFTGHMIDAPDRKKPRFPQKKEAAVTAKIRMEVEKVLKTIHTNASFSTVQPHRITAIGGGACGGDIIFHEVCRSMGIKSELYLALPPEKYVTHSVSFAGSDWVDRFYTLVRDPEIPHYVLTDSEELPSWLAGEGATYSLWERNNLWILHTALSKASRNLVLLALWDGKKGDGPGGTGHMINEVEKKGARSIIIKP